MDARRLRYLEAMGIRPWVRREREVAEGVPAPAPAIQHEAAAAEPPREDLPPLDAYADLPPVDDDIGADFAVPEAAAVNDLGQLDWSALAARVTECEACAELVANRSQTVFGVGNREAEWMVIGEAPGADEDRQGEPFVGRAGQLLNAMLLAVGLPRQAVYIANILKCRPPNNRDPSPAEAANCRGFLQRQIELVAPKLVLVVGRIAAQNLLGTDLPIGKLRGRVHRLADGTPVVVTYHPAYLLRSPLEKRKSWEDLRLALRTLAERTGES